MFSFECSRCKREKKRYQSRFESELNDAREEFVRLSRLLQDVCWYQFEVTASMWTDPWRPSDPLSHIDLIGQRFTHRYSRGHRTEHSKFPVWYEGPVCDAPQLPPVIILCEVRDAYLYFKACEKQVTAADDWAPGGRHYEVLARTTQVGRS